MSGNCKSLAKSQFVKFYPQLVTLLGNFDAAALLSYAINYASMADDGVFYKFNAPCAHPAYRDGDSWREALNWSRRRFEAARDAIATRISTGTKKPTGTHADNGDLLPFSAIMHYWVDGDNLTHWQVNFELLHALLNTYALPTVDIAYGMYKMNTPYKESKNHTKNHQREIDSNIQGEGQDISAKQEPETPETEAYRVLREFDLSPEVAAQFASYDVDYVRDWIRFIRSSSTVQSPSAYLIAMLRRAEPAPQRRTMPVVDVAPVNSNDTATEEYPIVEPCHGCGRFFGCDCDTVTEELPTQPKRGIENPLWQSVVNQAELQWVRHEWDWLLRDAILLDDTDNRFIIEVQTPAQADKLNYSYKRNLSALFREICGDSASFEVIVSPDYQNSNARLFGVGV